jgi:hypothetical protein
MVMPVGPAKVGRRKHVDERAGPGVIPLHLVGLPIRDEQVAVETDNEAERIAQGGGGHPDKSAGCPVVLPNGMVKLAGDEQAPGDHFSSLPVSAGLRP